MTEIVIRRRRMHPGQAAITESPARFRVVMCGRRFGKTILGISEAQNALVEGKSVGWFSPTYKYAVEPWDDLVYRLRPMARDVSQQERRMVLLNGGVLDTWTCDHPDPGRGRAYDLVVIDEAGIIANLDPIWNQAIRPTLIERAGRALFLGTPKGRTHAFSQLFAQAEGGLADWAAFRAPTADNPYIPREEIERERRSMLPAIFAQEYEGLPADDGANPFGLDAIRACTVSDPEAIVALGEGYPMTFGWDFARSQDYTVGIGLDRTYQVVRCHRWQGVDWGEQKARIQKLNGKVPSWGDATRSRVDDVIVQDLQRLGVPIQPFEFSQPSKQGLMQRLAVCIQERKLRIPQGVITAELEAFGYTYTQHGVRYESPEGCHDDCVMALALAVYGRDQYGDLPAPPGPIVNDDDTHPGYDWERAEKRKKHYIGELEEAPRGWRNRGPTVKLEDE